DLLTGIVFENAATIKNFNLEQNYPNPFNPKTIISYHLSKTNRVILSVYNLLGRKVATLVSGKQPAGRYQAEFNGSGLASGIYFYRLKTEQGTWQKKMILLK
ncbi:MAG: T9SS type A sorting domain-containing protein, partial [Calditrichaceae bacterium]